MFQGYRDLKDEFPGTAKPLRSKRYVTRFFGQGSELGGNGAIKAEVATTADAGRKKQLVDCFVKATHLLDPITYMKGEYEKSPDKRRHKLGEPMNQAYVDCLASWHVSKFREAGISPHFCEFFGAKVGVADKYYYNLSEEFEEYRGRRWFWTNKEAGMFDFKVFLGEDRRPLPEDLQEYFDKPADEELTDDSESEGGSTTSKKKPALDIDTGSSTLEICADEEILDGEMTVEAAGAVELESLHSEDMLLENSDTDESDESNDDNTSDATEEEEIQIFAELPNFPVMLICTERCEDTMDSLLYEEEFEGSWEKRWLAWIFQVVAALTLAQNELGLTHNDLHTNNILWKSTGEAFLHYRGKDGRYWKVPTYGKIFSIIDFGRSIFTKKDEDGQKKLIYSDDFIGDNDAAGQYNFGPFYNDKEALIEPNRSFDLVRLATGIYEVLFEEEKPNPKLGGKLLSKEEGLEVYESMSTLHDMLWTWLTDDEGKNTLVKPNGDERFPGFDLYQHIAKSCHKAVPEEQLAAGGWFSCFEVDGKKIKAGNKVYPLVL